MATRKLAEYTSKRSFDATPEPAGMVAEGRSGPLLFVVQKHSATRMHYDLRLECDGVLLSWAVPRGLSLDRTEKRLAVQTEDHPYGYGSFEGVIPPKQYGAGEVIVWDCGTYSPDEGGTWYRDRAEAERQVRDGLAAGKLSFTLRGDKLKGSFALVKTKEAKQWLVIKHKDRFVTTDDVLLRDRSVLSGISVEEMKGVPVKRTPAERLIPAGETVPMPTKLLPMLCTARLVGDRSWHGTEIVATDCFPAILDRSTQLRLRRLASSRRATGRNHRSPCPSSPSLCVLVFKITVDGLSN